MRYSHVIKINAPGGIFTPNKLQSIVATAYKAGVKTVQFGSRQQILFTVHKENLADFEEEFNKANIPYERDTDNFPNIVSSYPAEGIFSSDYWLSEGIYKDILDQFDFTPRLKINMVDDDQSLVPFFTGELNFIASKNYNFWYLYLNFDGTRVRWNRLIYSTDIAKMCREIEELYCNNQIKDIAEIMDMVNANTAYISTPVDKELEIPRFTFPYYEGVNKYGNNYWIGISRRNFEYPIPFIHELCQLCTDTKIAQICTTPWKSLIIKGITMQDRILWEKLLGKHGINVRHASVELNWLVEDLNVDEIELKKYLVNDFNERDIRTYGMVFGIVSNPNAYIPSSIVIEVNAIINIGSIKLFNLYNLYFTEDFNPNNIKRTLFAKNVTRSNLSKKLLALCKKYYAQLNDAPSAIKVNQQEAQTNPKKISQLYQCRHCFSIYDPEIGDSSQNILPGTGFSLVPESFTCFVCDSPKHDFEALSQENILKIIA